MTNGRVSSPNNPKSLRSSIRNNSEEMSDSESNPPSPKTGNNNLRENDEELSVESPGKSFVLIKYRIESGVGDFKRKFARRTVRGK